MSWWSWLTAMPGSQPWREKGLLDAQTNRASLMALSWDRLEDLVAEAYRRQGYTVARMPRRGADGGMDLQLRRNGRFTIVQVKQWRANAVGVAVVQQMFGVMAARRAHAVVIITSGRFTRGAWQFVKGKPITLIGGKRLMELVRSVQAGGGARFTG
jgi:restriction system protein